MWGLGFGVGVGVWELVCGVRGAGVKGAGLRVLGCGFKDSAALYPDFILSCRRILHVYSTATASAGLAPPRVQPGHEPGVVKLLALNQQLSALFLFVASR